MAITNGGGNTIQSKKKAVPAWYQAQSRGRSRSTNRNNSDNTDAVMQLQQNKGTGGYFDSEKHLVPTANLPKGQSEVEFKSEYFDPKMKDLVGAQWEAIQKHVNFRPDLLAKSSGASPYGYKDGVLPMTEKEKWAQEVRAGGSPKAYAPPKWMQNMLGFNTNVMEDPTLPGNALPILDPANITAHQNKRINTAWATDKDLIPEPVLPTLPSLPSWFKQAGLRSNVNVPLSMQSNPNAIKMKTNPAVTQFVNTIREQEPTGLVVNGVPTTIGVPATVHDTTLNDLLGLLDQDNPFINGGTETLNDILGKQEDQNPFVGNMMILPSGIGEGAGSGGSNPFTTTYGKGRGGKGGKGGGYSDYSGYNSNYPAWYDMGLFNWVHRD